MSPSRSLFLKIALLLVFATLILWAGRLPAEREERAPVPVLLPTANMSPAGPGVAPARPPARVARLPSPVSHPTRINLNRASVDELQTLPGIGPVLAQRIVARRTVKPFRAIEELGEVQGIGKKRLARLRPLVTVSSGGSPAVPPLPAKMLQ